jgi:precorrin-3B synthase
VPPSAARTRPDRCPGVLRPWPADDGALVRIRLAGGRLSASALAALTAVARRYGDGLVHLTGRANLQLRALPWDGDRLPEEVVAAVEATGLLPSRRHELARNLMCSPLTGLSGGRADLRPVVRELDERLCAQPELGDLPGRFLFVLDDGRGDLVGRETDLGAVVLDEETAQLRVGPAWGPVIGIGTVAEALVGLADRFLRERSEGPTAPWHVAELDRPLGTPLAGDPRLPAPADPPAYGDHGAAVHVAVPDGVLGPDVAADLAGSAHDLVVTPWHGVVVPTW